MDYCYLYHFFDNSTVAAVVTVFLGALLGAVIYKWQKEIDRRYSAKEKLTEALFSIEIHCKEFNLYFDRSVNTLALLSPEESENFFEQMFPEECDRMSEKLMDKLPKIVSEAESIFTVYFSNKTDIQDAFKQVIEEYQRWRAWAADVKNLGNAIKSKTRSDETDLSLEKLHANILDLVDSL